MKMIKDVCEGIEPIFTKEYKRVIMTDDQVEQEIQAKGLTAPRVTPEDIKEAILYEEYFKASAGLYGSNVFPSDIPAEAGLVTICFMILKNGHRIVGVNTGPVSADNFDFELAKKLARQNAIDQIWPLMGYALRERIHKNLVEKPKSEFVGPM